MRKYLRWTNEELYGTIGHAIEKVFTDESKK